MLYDYRGLVGNPRYGALGLIVLPLGFFAIIGGILLFGVALYQLIQTAVMTYLRSVGVPLEYTVSSLVPNLSSFEWFYFPITMFVLLVVIAALGSILFVIVGKVVSKTPATLGLGVFAYLLAYGLIAPFWLLRSVGDVLFNHRRAWR